MPNHTLAVYPPLDGTVLTPNLLDFNIDHNAELTAFVFSDSPGSVTKISYLEYGRAAHRVGHAVRPGRTGLEGQVVAVIANLDTLLYAALVAGLIRAGIVVCFRCLTPAKPCLYFCFAARPDLTA